MSTRLCFAGALVLLATAPASAGILSAANFPSLQAAIDAAASGDVVLASGTWTDGFTIDGKGIAVLADHSQVVHVGPSTTGNCRVINVPAGQTAVLRGFDIQALGGVTPQGDSVAAIDLEVESCAGTVWIEECTFTTGGPSLQIRDCANVALVKVSAAAASGTGAVIERSRVAAVESTFAGAAGSNGGQSGFGSMFPAIGGGAGLSAKDGAQVSLEHCGAFGGAGGNGFGIGLVCTPPAQGGPGVSVGTGPTGPALVRGLATVLAGGTGGFGSCPPAAADGLPAKLDGGQFVATSPPAAGFSIAPNPAREGDVVTLTPAVQPGDLTLLLLSASPGGTYVPAGGGTLLAGPPSLVAGIPGTTFLLVPELGPGVSGVAVYVQRVRCPFGTGCTLGTSTALQLLDAAY